MTAVEYNKIKVWNIIENILTGNKYIVLEIKDNGLEFMNLTNSFGVFEPMPDILKKYNITNETYTPSFSVINHMIELYKKYEEEKPNGIFISAYIKNNW